MSSPSTFHAIFGGTKRNQIAPQILSTTTETIFVVNTDTTGTTSPAVLSLPLQTAIEGAKTPYSNGANAAITFQTGREYGIPKGTSAPYFNSTSFDGKPFLLHLQGTFTSGVAANDLLISLYLGSSATIGSDHSISAALTTGTSANFGAVSGKFAVEYLLQWDSTTGKLDGVVTNGFIAPSGVAATVIGGTAVTETSAVAYTNVQFVASAKWNAANAGNTVNIQEFSLSEF